MSSRSRVTIDRTALAALCQRHHIRRLALFGSVLRADFGPDSDVDVLYEFEDGFTPSWAIVEIAEHLSGLFGGRKVDLVPFKYLNVRMRESVLRDAEPLYGAA